MKSFITWCFILALFYSPILAEDEEEDDHEQNKRQTIFSTASTLPASLLHAPSAIGTSAALVAAPTATVSPIIHATSAPILHTPSAPILAAPSPFPLTRTIINHGAIVPVARPLALPLPAPAIPYQFAYPIQKPAIPLQVAHYPAAYPALTHAFAPSSLFLPHGLAHSQLPIATASTSALKVVPAPNLAPSFSPVYRYGVAPFGFGFHPALKYF